MVNLNLLFKSNRKKSYNHMPLSDVVLVMFWPRVIKKRKSRSKVIPTSKNDERYKKMHRLHLQRVKSLCATDYAHRMKIKPLQKCQKSKYSLFVFMHAAYSMFALCVFLIQRSSRSPADSTVWNGKQHVVRQSPSVWRLEAACWPLFNVNIVSHTAPWWII